MPNTFVIKNITTKVGLLLIIAAILYVLFPSSLYSWGFYGHKKVNRMAVFTLPSQMIGFYKQHIEYLTEHGTDPDRRSFADEKEAVRHFIDIEFYDRSGIDSIPHRWADAVATYSEDSLNKHGVNPWYVETMYYRLIDAFKNQDADEVLYISANLGHYIADACTPLHTTQYYNGKTKDQKGIHSFWESRIPELFAEDYDFFVGQANYIEKPQRKIWQAVVSSHRAIDTIYMVLDKMTLTFPSDQVYAYETKGKSTMKVYSSVYAAQFSLWLQGMVERRMRLAVKLVGDLWYTAWVNAGQPDLSLMKKTNHVKFEEQNIPSDCLITGDTLQGRL